MWFDAKAKLAEIVGHPPATSATPATPATPAVPVSQLSRVSQAPVADKQSFVAKVASVAASPTEPEPSGALDPDLYRHGRSVAGGPLTWSGRVVNLDEWRGLSAWERHGPDGRLWCGLCHSWHFPGACGGARDD